MLVHDIIKIKYVSLGYIKKNYPYHLISDEEMFNAFIDAGTGLQSNLIDPKVRFFDMYYPNPFAEEDVIYKKRNSKGEVIEEISLSGEYNKLKSYMISVIKDHVKYSGTPAEDKYPIPSWIYTYMLGEVVYQQSDYRDIYDALELLGCANLDNEFTQQACVNCYATSLSYISTLTTGLRPPTVFGEPHVIKNLRMYSPYAIS
jgi:hypothetical protein